MKEIRQHLEKAWDYLAKIPVNGDFVEPMALARQELRSAYALAETREKEKDTKKGETRHVGHAAEDAKRG